MKTEMKITIGTVCFVLDNTNNKILLLKRKNEPMQNLFTGVGGKTEFKEDINSSCIREIKEETGLNVDKVNLKGILKTILEGKNSSWILFVYTTASFIGNVMDCNEGELIWINKKDVFSKNLIDFIRRILPSVLKENEFIEGTIIHDAKGNVIKETLNINSSLDII